MDMETWEREVDAMVREGVAWIEAVDVVTRRMLGLQPPPESGPWAWRKV